MPKSKRRIRPATKNPNCAFGTTTVKESTGTGGLAIVKHGMQIALPVPCIQCPLRRDSAAGYLGGYTPQMYLDILHGPASIACHCSPGFREGDLAQQHHCTGVAAFRANVGHIAQMNDRATVAHASTLLVGPDPDLFFASDAEFVTHHQPGQKPQP